MSKAPSLQAVIPPADIVAEQSILGSMLLTPFAVDTALDSLSPSDFYRLEHQRIFTAIASVAARGMGVDIVTVSSELARERGADDATLHYLHDLMRSSVARGNIASQAQIVIEHATRRKLAQVAQTLAVRAYDLEVPLTDLVASAESSVMDATAAPRGGDSYATVPDLLDDVFAKMEWRSTLTGIPGISSGIQAWDQLTLGMQAGNLYIWAGRPSMGKSAAMTGLMLSAAMASKRVAVFSLEMSKQELVERALASMGRVSITSILRGRFSPEESRLLDKARRGLAGWRVAIDDTPALTLAQIISRARRMRSELGGLDMLLVDYIGLVKPDPLAKHGTRAEALSAIANGFKAAAKQLDVPVGLLAQISRSVESRENKRPQLSDLKESGGIEEAADVVTLLYRPCYYKPQESTPDTGVEPAEWIVAKGRNVGTGTVKTTFSGQFTRFDDMPEDLHHDPF